MEILSKITELPVDAISIENRLRDVDPDGVANLVQTIQEIGFLGRIIVRRTPEGDTVADGAHRLTAARDLGMATIPCEVVRCNDDEARLIEVYGNTAGAGLTDLQLAYFLSQRRKAYQRLNPDAVRGKAGAKARWDATANFALAKAIAKERGVSTRKIEYLMQAGDAIDETEYRALCASPIAIKQADLLCLAKMGDTGDRRDVITMLRDGKAKSAKAALKSLRAEAPSAVSPDDKSFLALKDAWARANTRTRRRFVETHQDEIAALIDGEDEAPAFSTRRGGA